MAAATPNRSLIITGMHRSGTSLAARMFERAGVHIGSELIPPDPGNRHGYHEDKRFVAFHDELLSRTSERVFVQTKAYRKALRKGDADWAERLIRERIDDGLWGFKDPRASLFLDFWSQLLPHARFVFMLRHPIDVVASLMRRDSAAELEVRVDPLAGLRSWGVYNHTILEFFERHSERCLLCDVYRIVEDPEALIRAARQKLELPLEVKPLDELIHLQDLHAIHAARGVDAVLRQAVPKVARLYRKLESMADFSAPDPGTAENDHPELAGRLEIVAGLLSSKAADRAVTRSLMSAVLGWLDPEAGSLSGLDVRSRLSKTEKQLHDLLEHCEALEKLRVEADRQLRDCRRHAENLEQLVADRDTTLGDQETCVVALESLRRESDEHARDLSRHCENLERRVAELEALCEGLEAHRENLEGELGRRQASLDAFASHAEDLKAERERNRGRVAELAKHAEDLESELARRQTSLDASASHAENLSVELERYREVTPELAKHAEDLEGELEQRRASYDELTSHAENLSVELERYREVTPELAKHAEDLEGELEQRRASYDELTSHAENLSVELERRQEQMAELAKHAENLTGELGHRQASLDGLASHVENLEADRVRDQSQIRELSEHAKQLGRLRAASQRQLEELASHVENLEADRERDSEVNEGLKRHVDNLESLRETLEGRLSRRDAELDIRRMSFDAKQREAIRLNSDLIRLRSHWWVRLGIRLRLIR